MTDTQPSRPVPLDDASSAPNTGAKPGVAPTLQPSVPIKPTGGVKEGARLGWLVRLMGLEHYSGVFLTRKIRNELKILAVMLLSVFLVEFAAWTFFFNGLLVGDVDRFRIGGTTAAVALGLIFSGVILYFERQVITVDVSRLTPWKKRLAQIIRIGTIIGAGFIVAHAVDLLAFQTPVAKWLHAEAVYQEASRLTEDIDGMGRASAEDRQEAIDEDLRAIRKQTDQASSRKTEAVGVLERLQQQVPELQQQIVRARVTIDEAEGRLSRLEFGGADPAVIEAARRKLTSARQASEVAAAMHQTALGNQGAALATIQQIDRQIEELKTMERQIMLSRGDLFDETDDLHASRELLRSRLRDWIAWLGRSEPGDRVEEWAPLAEVADENKNLWPERWREPLDPKQARSALVI